MSEFQDFVRKQFPVQAARVTPLNIQTLAEACGGRIMHDAEKEGHYSRDYIKVRVAFPLNEDQTRAHIGDWLVKQGRSFKVYKDKAFRNTFENRDGTPVPRENPQNLEQAKPSPANMPKKRTVADEQAEFAAEQEKKAQDMVSENQVAAAVEQTPAPRTEMVDPETVGDPSENKLMVDQVEEVDKAFEEVDAAYPEPEMAPAEEVKEAATAIAEEDKELLERLDRPEGEPDPEENPGAILEKKPITLDELNERPGDPRTADDIHREGQQQG